MSVKVRIAPSPTGNLHVGTARTALFNWLFARHYGGSFVLRIEDTDTERSDARYEQSILEGLTWLGILWDGEVSRQSERRETYREFLRRLIDSGKAFWCHHSIQELEAEKKLQMELKEPPRHICQDKYSARGKQPGQIIRLAGDETPGRSVVFNDLIRGPIQWSASSIGDLSLAKNEDTPLYNFAVVADDIDMQITHVIRGEDHISNTPKQVLIYQALGAKMPEFAHVPLILGADKSKLSKRHGATDIIAYKKDYLPEAMVNFMGFLGYTYDKEILTKEEMAGQFDITKVHKNGAVFDAQKLNWVNAQYVRHLSPDAFRSATGVSVPDAAIPLMTERLERLSDVQNFSYFWNPPAYEADLLIWKTSPRQTVRDALEKARDALAHNTFATHDELRATLDALADQLHAKGLIYWPVRVALTGSKASPDPLDIAFVLGKDESLRRIDAAIQKLS